MPEPVGQPVESALAVLFEDVRIAIEVGDVGNLVPHQAVLDPAMPRLLRRRMDRPEMAGEVDLLVVRKLLVVEHDDRIAVDGRHDGVPVGCRQRLGKVDPGNLGEELRLGRLDGDAHDHLLRL